MAPRHSPLRFFLLTAVLGAGALCLLAERRWGLGWPWAYALGVNTWTLLAYAYDKAAARRGALRIPEAMLHLLALAGGTPAALAGRWLFHHKTAKRSFRTVLGCIVALQLAALAILLWRR